jgi:SAM-dependent methyltransferase
MGDSSYAATYAATHAAPITPAYVAGYAEFVLLDSMLSDYRLLIVGAGTGGFVRLLKNHREIVCIDRLPEMVAKAEPHPRVSYMCADFANYEGTFDAISVAGTYGWYEPWTGREWVLEKCRSMLAPNGILIASYTPPKSAFQRVKEIVFPRRTVVIDRQRFIGMARRAGFEEVIGFHRLNAVSILTATP